MIIRHMYYHDPEKFDLQKMKADAYKFSQGDQYTEPQEVLIHFHPAESKCHMKGKKKQKHISYAAKEEAGD